MAGVVRSRLLFATVLAASAMPASGGGRPGKAVRVEGDKRVEVFVPAGTFVMGVDEDDATSALAQCQFAYFSPNQVPRPTSPLGGGYTDFCSEYFVEMSRMPPRTVYLDAFSIDRDEVSVEDYRACVARGGCALDALVSGDERYIMDDGPMVNVTWDEAQTFCRWRGGRLPTEAEWERAARGDLGFDWPWGDLERPKDFNHGRPRANALRDLERQPTPVPIKFFGDPDDTDGFALLAPRASFPWGESPYGTRDQAGNVAEWTLDAHYTDEARRGYDTLPAINPVREGPTSQTRVIRGGSWRQPMFVARTNLRDPFNTWYEANGRFSHVGFRCARSVR